MSDESTRPLATTSRNLAVDLRPKSFNEFIGSPSIINQIRTQLGSGHIPTAILLSGPTGCGKTTLARCIASALEAELIEVNAADDTGVDAARALGEKAQYLPDPGYSRKVIVLDEGHQLTKQAQNALLKHVEDAPPSTVWVVCTTEPSKIISTLRGRCISFALQGLTPDGVSLLVYRGLQYLGKKNYAKTEEFIQSLVREAVTSPRAVLMATERFGGGMDPLSAIFGTQDAPQAFEIARAVAKGSWDTVRSFISQATAEEAMVIRIVVVNYLKAMALKSSNPLKLMDSILDLTATIPFEGPLGLAELSARLYVVCARLKS